MNQGQKYYHVGGNLNLDDPSYIERQADRNLYQKLEAGNFCYVFNSRQMGKSSLRVRVKKNLETAGFRCVVISLDKFGTKGFTEEQWYNSLIKNIAHEFHLQTEPLLDLTPLDRLSSFFENKLLAEIEQKIVIFIDEIETVLSLDFPTDDFFVFIRSCYNERANNPLYDRVTFALLGVATRSQLIQDKQRTPFNIGEAIQLKGFSLQEARPLTRGLESKVNDPIITEYILREILKWTGGQPFLTQKIFKIIADDKNIIPSDENLISKWIEGLVKLRIIENWEYQDEPQHLRTIHNRIINSKQPLVKLLKFYLKVLQDKELPVNDSLEQSELILSGLLEEINGKLKVYNLIYESVFNSNWVAEMLAEMRPYEEQLLRWLSSNRQDKSSLLQGEQLQKAIAWRDGKILNIEDYQFINASQEREIANLEIKIQKKERFQRLLAGITFSMMIIAGVSGLQLQTKIQSEVLGVPYVSDPERFSQGERTFFLGNSNLYQNLGVKAFKEGNYPQAIEFFRKAKTIDKTDPEAEIYYNNARAHQREIEQNKKPLTLAVVVLVNQRRVVAQEILKGVALAQTNWNDRGGLNGHLLNIVIANDEGNPNLAQKVAQEFNKDSNVLGVIGHYTSPTTESTMPEYDKAGLAMISPGSTSTKLIEKRSKETNKVFFRTTPSDQFSGQLLADYAIKNNIKKAVICFTSKDIFSVSIKEAFLKSFQDRGGKIVETIDLENPFNASDTLLISILRKKPDAAVFFPNTEQIPIAINIAQEIKNTQSGLIKKPQLLGGNTLYGVDILRSGQDAIEGLTVTIPWFPEEANKNQFVKQASQRWQGVVTWQNATSYDATQAFIKALSESKEKEPTRATVLANIPKIQLLPDETSGGGLKFTKNGEREMKPALVRVVRCSAEKCQGMEGGFYFEKVPKN